MPLGRAKSHGDGVTHQQTQADKCQHPGLALRACTGDAVEEEEKQATLIDFCKAAVALQMTEPVKCALRVPMLQQGGATFLRW